MFSEVWNQNECAEHVIEALNMLRASVFGSRGLRCRFFYFLTFFFSLRFLVAFDVDFATVIELADSTYQSPSKAQAER